MKKIIILSVFVAGVCISCTKDNDKSDAYGNFEATEIMISAENQGVILELPIVEGQVCQKGQVAGIIDTTHLYLQREQARAQVAAVMVRKEGIEAQINVQYEQKRILMTEQERLENLFRDGAATQKQLDDLDGQLRTLEQQIMVTKTNFLTINAEINALTKQVNLISDQFSRCIIRNPITGTILEKYAEPFEMAIPGKTLYKIADLSEMILRVYVSGDQLPAIATGQKVTVLIDKDQKQYEELEGTISWISDRSEFTPKIIQTKKERVNLVYAVKVRVINDGRLKIGMPGEIRFK